MCTTSHLTITVVDAGSGLGHGGFIIRFQNAGKPCGLHGYPGLDAVDASGRVVQSAQRSLSGYLGGLASGVAEPYVALQKGQAASALAEGLNALLSGQPCPAYPSVVVTPPSETHSVVIPSAHSVCYLTIHPVVPGTTGNDS